MPLAAVGYLDGTLAIYDLSTQTLRHQCQHQVQAAWSHGHGCGEGPVSGLAPARSFSVAIPTPFRHRSWEQMTLLSPAPDLCLASVVPCCSLALCSCCGRQALLWFTLAAWMASYASGMLGPAAFLLTTGATRLRSWTLPSASKRNGQGWGLCVYLEWGVASGGVPGV